MHFRVKGKSPDWPDTKINVARSALLKTGESGQVYVGINQKDGDHMHIGMWLSSEEVDKLVLMLAFYREQTDHDKDFFELKET